MNSSLFKSVLIVGLLAFSGVAMVSAKPVNKFQEYKGTFKGTSTFVVSEGNVLPGTATITGKGPGSGASTQITLKGVITTGMTSTPYSNAFTFKRNGNFVVSDGVFGLLGGTTKFPVRGKAKIGKLTINGKGNFTAGSIAFQLRFTIKSKTVGKKQTLTIDYVLSNSGGTFPFKFVGSRTVKKK